MIWAARYAAATNGRGYERVGLCPSAGLEALSPAVAEGKLAGLANAARKAGLPAGRAGEHHRPACRGRALGCVGSIRPDEASDDERFPGPHRRTRSVPPPSRPPKPGATAFAPSGSRSTAAARSTTRPISTRRSPSASGTIRGDRRRHPGPAAGARTKPADTWLDIGAGGGRYALPIALHAKARHRGRPIRRDARVCSGTACASTPSRTSDLSRVAGRRRDAGEVDAVRRRLAHGARGLRHRAHRAVPRRDGGAPRGGCASRSWARAP